MVWIGVEVERDCQGPKLMHPGGETVPQRDELAAVADGEREGHGPPGVRDHGAGEARPETGAG